MSDVAVSARNLSKVYRLYRRPADRFLDMLGLLKPDSNRVSFHAALSNVSFTIRRGEKVAIIGRNGAGKSTLLRIISGVVAPTSGDIDVMAKVSALLTIGAGFHTEFTGRENAMSYLAQLGLPPREIERKVKDIIAFAEIEEYIDQPLKTYSTGMGARLSFATATVIDPDLLILDEVLSVGDAYFGRKSLERMTELADTHGTTVLLVTHDFYSAQRLCDRFLWLDQGQLKMDGPSRMVLEAYELSIKEQEERRLDTKRLMSLRENRLTGGIEAVHCSLQRKGGRAEGPALAIARITALVAGQEVARIEIGTADHDGPNHLVLDPAEGNWGPAESHTGVPSRALQKFGSIFHRLPWICVGGKLGEALAAGQLSFSLRVRAEADETVELIATHPDGRQRFTAEGTVPGGAWQDVTLTPAIAALELAEPADGQKLRRYGNRRVEITDVAFLDAQRRPKHQFKTGETLLIELAYQINDETFDEKPVLIVAMMKDGVLRTHRFYSKNIRLSAKQRRSGTISMLCDPLLLGAGTYGVTVGAYREGYFEGHLGNKFFSASPDVYDLHPRAYEIGVTPGSENLLNDVVFFHASRWRLDGSDEIVEQLPPEGG